MANEIMLSTRARKVLFRFLRVPPSYVSDKELVQTVKKFGNHMASIQRIHGCGTKTYNEILEAINAE